MLDLHRVCGGCVLHRVHTGVFPTVENQREKKMEMSGNWTCRWAHGVGCQHVVPFELPLVVQSLIFMCPKRKP